MCPKGSSGMQLPCASLQLCLKMENKNKESNVIRFDYSAFASQPASKISSNVAWVARQLVWNDVGSDKCVTPSSSEDAFKDFEEMLFDVFFDELEQE